MMDNNESGLISFIYSKVEIFNWFELFDVGPKNESTINSGTTRKAMTSNLSSSLLRLLAVVLETETLFSSSY